MNIERLLPAARLRLEAEFYEEGLVPPLDEFVKPFEREVSLDAARTVVNHLLAQGDDKVSTATDAWLAPRFHAAVRISRREAATVGIWTHMAVLVFPDYVRARWGAEPGRYFANEVNGAMSRLWWGAELSRNGPDYAPVLGAFHVQDIPNTWFRLDAFHSRPLAIALTRVIRDEGLTGRQVNALATATNLRLTTTVLDALAPPVERSDEKARAEWLAGTPDGSALIGDNLPLGPDDQPVPDSSLERAESFLRELLPSLKVRG